MEIFKDNISKLERLTRRERLGELLIRSKLLKLNDLVDLMSAHKYNLHGPFGEFLVDKNLINRKQLLNILNQQKNQDRVIDSCLEKLGFMTNAQKWEVLTRCEKLGELLVKHCNVNFNNLIKCIEIQENTRPERLLGDIMIENGITSNSQIKKALEIQHLQQNVINKTIDELMDVTQLPINIKIRRINSMWISF